MAKWGLGLTRQEVKDFVKVYVDANIKENNETRDYLRKYCRFKNNILGDDWLGGFLSLQF